MRLAGYVAIRQSVTECLWMEQGTIFQIGKKPACGGKKAVQYHRKGVDYSLTLRNMTNIRNGKEFTSFLCK